MRPEEQLDALLSRRQVAGAEPAQREDLDGLGALLDVADEIAVWGAETPDPTFASQLESQLLARFASPALGAPDERDATAQDGSSPAVALEPEIVAEPARIIPFSPPHVRRRAPRLPRLPRLARQARPLQRTLVAALLLVVGLGALTTAAATATPGQPLYALRQWGGGLLPGGAANGADARARQHLQGAQDALDSFDAAVARGDLSPASAALATFVQQEQAAASDLRALPASAARDALTARLGALQDRGRRDLRAALPSLDWATRAVATAALGDLGEQVPHVARASISGVTINGDYIWIITLNGSDFAPNAQVLIDGQPAGTIVSRSPTAIVAHIPGAALSAGGHSLGVGAPDDEASILSGVSSNAPATDDHGGSKGSDSGGTNGGSSGGSDDGAKSGHGS